MQPPITSINLM